MFSRDALWTCDPRLLKAFANSDLGAHPGNQATFDSTWNAMGDTAAGDETSKTLKYLLYGPAAGPARGPAPHLLAGTVPFAMTGFKEALLTRVLCVMQPDRFLSILKCTTEAGGKRETARMVYGTGAAGTRVGELDPRPAHPLEQRPPAPSSAMASPTSSTPPRSCW
ncbi:hypothetical protein [Streptomyces europaeiscabiei]|uniref:hypothetical protein n=1 Tax=Streptomyces europaeiscabiei TaxID=146819 RepID=UPI002E10F96E|nr:hypothetical protein OHB30_13235 [Streptomyces europaeiscabiei]